MTTLRPRTAVIADAWRAAEVQAPAFTGREGRPVARAVKCLLDPLILQPRRRAHLGRRALDDAAAAEITELLVAHRQRLADADAWYGMLRAERRRRGIADGNAQELYFPRAYELAALHGAPGADALERCGEVLDEVHAQPSGDAVGRYFEDAAGQAAARAHVDAAWARERPGEAAAPVDALAERVRRLLDAGTELRRRAAWRELTADGDAARLGEEATGVAGRIAAYVAASEGAPASAISAHDPVIAPPCLDAVEAAVLDRDLARRTRAALRRWREHSVAPPLDELVEIEAHRTAAPWGLEDATLGTVFVVGIAAAGGLDPLGAPAPREAPDLVRALQAQARASAHVLHLRRTLRDGLPVHPDQAGIVAELQRFAHPYLRRLWARLHGRDVLDAGIDDGGEVAELLTGILRSVLQDEKQRLRAVLEREGRHADAMA